ncbi:MAG: ketopantoate reductase family protein [Spirochaetes bacterium]|nr:ketopantoate reductase family protein [Spirochaetota bacterium]
MKVLIYGAGSVGLGIASCLLKSGVSLDIVSRKSTVDSINKQGLKREGIFGNFHALPYSISAADSLADFSSEEYDFILVCTKSYDSEKAALELSQFPDLLGNNGKIVLFQNGWGNAEKFTAFFEQDVVYNARVITGFTLIEKNCVKITVHADAIHIGSLYGREISCMSPLSEAITLGGIDCIPSDKIGHDLWSKMLYNCALNSTGAVFEVPYGVLGNYSESREIMNTIITEAFTVMQAAGYRTHWEKAEDFQADLYSKLIPVTAEHKSSTLQDILAGKKTEIDALNGAVINIAKQYNIPVPANKLIYAMVNLKSRITNNQIKK